MDKQHAQRVMQSIIKERVKSLLDDGYTLLFKSTLMTSVVYRLRHRSNGNVVTMHVYYNRNWLQQFTNGTCTYNNPIWNNREIDA